MQKQSTLIKKDPADWVFFNVKFSHNSHEAIAIYKGKIVDIGSIPYIFSNYRGFKDFNAQGNPISFSDSQSVEIGQKAHGLVVYKENQANLISKSTIIWEIVQKDCIERNTGHLDPHWDDH